MQPLTALLIASFLFHSASTPILLEDETATVDINRSEFAEQPTPVSMLPGLVPALLLCCVPPRTGWWLLRSPIKVAGRAVVQWQNTCI